MNDQELDDLLQRATVPGRSAGYWDGFPRQVLDRIARSSRFTGAGRLANRGAWTSRFRVPSFKVAFGVGLAVACVAFVMAWKISNGRESSGHDPQFAEMRRCFQEIESLFPNQVQAIVFGPSGPSLVLADKANVPASPPLYLRICVPDGCLRFITFSGQQIYVNGEACDVLLDGRGGVMVVGQRRLWSGPRISLADNPHEIDAKPLEKML